MPFHRRSANEPAFLSRLRYALAQCRERFGSADVLSAVLNAGRFIEMSEAEQKRFLAQMVEARKMDIPDEIGDALRAPNEEAPRFASVGDVEAAYRRFYELRTEANRSLKALGQMEKPDTPSDLPTVQEVKGKLEDLRQQRERLVAEKADAAASWENAQERLIQVRAEIEEVSSEILSPCQEQALLQLESQRSHAEKLRQELTGLIAEQKAIETSLAALQGLKGKCPACRRPISEELKTKEMEALRERFADLEGLIQGAKEELNEYAEIGSVASRLEGHRNPRGLLRRRSRRGTARRSRS